MRRSVIAIYDSVNNEFKKYIPFIYKMNTLGDFEWQYGKPWIYLNNEWTHIGGSGTLWVYLLDSNGDYILDSNNNNILVKED